MIGRCITGFRVWVAVVFEGETIRERLRNGRFITVLTVLFGLFAYVSANGSVGNRIYEAVVVMVMEHVALFTMLHLFAFFLPDSCAARDLRHLWETCAR